MKDLAQENTTSGPLLSTESSPSAPTGSDETKTKQAENRGRPRQSMVLLKYWTKGKKRGTFILHFFQHLYLIIIIFTATTIFTNYDIVFGHIASLLNQGQNVGLSNSPIPVTSISISSVNWSLLSSSLAQTVITTESGYLVGEMNRVMLFTGIIVIGLLILRESWIAFHESRLTFLQLELPIRSVLYHGCSRRAVISFDIIMGSIQVLASYAFGALIAIYLVIPLIESVVRDTFMDFLVSSIPLVSFVVALIPVILILLISSCYFVVRIRTVKLN